MAASKRRGGGREASDGFARIVRWLERHAPRTRASLLPPPGEERLRALAAKYACELPEGIAHLYARSGGQAESAPAGIFFGYTMMPIDGVDGLDAAWDSMLEAAESGAPWATKDRYPFAKDFGGSYLCVDMEARAAGRVIEIDDGGTVELAPDMESFLAKVATSCEEGKTTIDERVETVESFEIVFDAARERRAGDAVTHSVLTELGIDAVVESLEQYASDFDGEPYRYGFYVRMIPRAGDVRITSYRLEDDRRHVIEGVAGHGTGGGKPGVFLYVRTRRAPLPPGSRLYVTLGKVSRG